MNNKGTLIVAALLWFFLVGAMLGRCKAGELTSLSICQTGTIPADGIPRTVSWQNKSGLPIYIRSIEVRMIAPDLDQTHFAHLFKISEYNPNPTPGSVSRPLVNGGIYCPIQSPVSFPKDFAPDYILINAGDGLILQYGLSFTERGPIIPAPADYVIIWYTTVKPL